MHYALRENGQIKVNGHMIDMNDRWVLRDENGEYVDHDRYRYDLEQRVQHRFDIDNVTFIEYRNYLMWGVPRKNQAVAKNGHYHITTVFGGTTTYSCDFHYTETENGENVYKSCNVAKDVSSYEGAVFLATVHNITTS